MKTKTKQYLVKAAWFVAGLLLLYDGVVGAGLGLHSSAFPLFEVIEASIGAALITIAVLKVPP